MTDFNNLGSNPSMSTAVERFISELKIMNKDQVLKYIESFRKLLYEICGSKGESCSAASPEGNVDNNNVGDNPHGRSADLTQEYARSTMAQFLLYAFFNVVNGKRATETLALFIVQFHAQYKSMLDQLRENDEKLERLKSAQSEAKGHERLEEMEKQVSVLQEENTRLREDNCQMSKKLKDNKADDRQGSTQGCHPVEMEIISTAAVTENAPMAHETPNPSGHLESDTLANVPVASTSAQSLESHPSGKRKLMENPCPNSKNKKRKVEDMSDLSSDDNHGTLGNGMRPEKRINMSEVGDGGLKETKKSLVVQTSRLTALTATPERHAYVRRTVVESDAIFVSGETEGRGKNSGGRNKNTARPPKPKGATKQLKTEKKS